MRTVFFLALLTGVAAISPAQNHEKKVALAHQGHQDMAPMAGSVKCVVMLLVAYFFCYSVTAVFKMFLEWMGQSKSPILDIIELGCKYVDFAPVLSIMFLATRLRAVSLSNGFVNFLASPNCDCIGLMQIGGIPSELAQTSMLAASSCVIANVGLTVLFPLVSGEYSFGASSLGPVAEDRKGLAGMVASIKGLIGIAQTVFVAIVVYETIMMKAPAGKSSAVSPAVMCTIILTCMYFLTYVLYEGCVIIGGFIAGTNEDGSTKDSFLKSLEASFSMAQSTMKLAPMMAMLFIAIRMRALTMGRDGPQSWAQDLFFATTYGLVATCILVVLGPLIFGAKVKEGIVDGDVTFEISNSIVAAVFTAARYVCIFSIYIGLAAAVVSTFLITPPAGHAHTPMSTAVATTLVFTDLFFMCYIGIWAATTCKQFMGESSATNTAILMFDGMKTAIQFVPMLCVLFLAARLRAIQVVGSQRAPQNWAQYFMWFSVLAVFFSALSGFLGPLINTENSTCKAINNVLRIVLLLGVHASAIAVTVSLFLISKKTAGDLGLKDPATWSKDAVSDVVLMAAPNCDCIGL